MPLSSEFAESPLCNFYNKRYSEQGTSPTHPPTRLAQPQLDCKALNARSSASEHSVAFVPIRYQRSCDVQFTTCMEADGQNFVKFPHPSASDDHLQLTAQLPP